MDRAPEAPHGCAGGQGEEELFPICDFPDPRRLIRSVSMEECAQVVIERCSLEEALLLLDEEGESVTGEGKAADPLTEFLHDNCHG